MRILGVNAYHADSAAALLEDGSFTAGVEEERLTRIKHWAGFPERAIDHCLHAEGRSGEPLTALAVARDPRAHFFRKALLAISNPRSLPRAFSRLRNLAGISSLGPRIHAVAGDPSSEVPLHFVEHHAAHLASAFFCSPFEEAMCLSVDGFGDLVSTTLGVGRGSSIEVESRVHFPHSLGLLYTAITQYLGFPHYGDEYKVMGLAAYGEPVHCDLVGRMAPMLRDGRFKLDLRFFRHVREGVAMDWESGAPRLGTVFTRALEELLGPARRPDDDLTQRHRDLAASAQRVYEERFFAMVRGLQERTGLPKLALAGGCGFNSLANGRLLDHTDVEEAAAADSSSE